MSASGELFERAISISSLRSAFEEEQRRDGPPGTDYQRAADFGRQLKANLRRLQEELNEGSYRCLPVLRHFIPKKHGGKRPLAICTLRDRLVQRSLARVLTPPYERQFLDCSHGYRPGRSAETALRQIQRLRESGLLWAYEADIEDCFGSVQADLLGEEIDRLCQDPRMRRLVLQILQSGALEHGLVRHNYLGLPQGSPLSPLLANIYLHPFDQFLTTAGFALVRYADDFLLLAASEQEAEQAADAAEEALRQRRMRPAPDKTRIVSLEEGVVFLGFSIDHQGLRPRPQAIWALQQRLREVHTAQQREEATTRLTALLAVLRGWRNYFPCFGDFWPEAPEIALAAAEVALEKRDLPALRRFLPLGETRLPASLRQRWQTLQQKAQPLLQQQEVPSPNRAGRLCSFQPEPLGSGTPLQQHQGGVLPARSATMTFSRIPGAGGRRSFSEVMSPLAARISLLRHQIHLSPSDLSHYHQLAEAYLHSGQYVLAHSILQQTSASPQGKPHDGTPLLIEWLPEGPLLSLSLQDQERYLRLFRGREGMVGQAAILRDGRVQFQATAVPLSALLLRQHLEGKKIVALYPINEEGECRLGGVEVAPSRRLWLRYLDQPRLLQGYEEQAQQWISQLAEQFQQAGLGVLLEQPGYNDRRLWFFLESPMPLKRLHAFLQSMVRLVAPLPEGLALIFFPERASSSLYDPGRPVVLPLGAHPVSGKRSLFLDPTSGKPLNVETALRQISPCEGALVEAQWLRQERLQGHGDIAARFPTSFQLLHHCLVLRLLVDKLQATRYLENTERVSLLYTFGHLGEEGLHFLHAALSLCPGYNHHKTSRWIEKRRPFPISCPRLREKHAELLGSARCQCNLRRFPRHGYPTPLLHLLPPSKVFDPKQLKPPSPQPQQPLPQQPLPQKGKGKREGERQGRGAENAPSPAPAGHPLPRSLRPPSRRSAGKEGSTTGEGKEEEALTPPRGAEQGAPGDPLPLLRRGEGGDRRGSEERRERKDEEQGGSGSPPSLSLDELAELTRLYVELERNLKGVQRSLERVKDQLSQAFDAHSVDVFQTPTGCLRRTRRPNAPDKWIFVPVDPPEERKK